MTPMQLLDRIETALERQPIPDLLGFHNADELNEAARSIAAAGLMYDELADLLDELLTAAGH